MKNLILLFTLVFAFGFSQTIQAQPVPGEVVNETKVEKPNNPQKTTCERPKKGKATKANMKEGNAKKTCCKGQKGQNKGKAVKAKNQQKHEEHRYHKATGKHGHGKAKMNHKDKK
ncbi:MAG: hypothetical protein AB8G11_23135 [Saprospiraceae bacterium]